MRWDFWVWPAPWVKEGRDVIKSISNIGALLLKVALDEYFQFQSNGDIADCDSKYWDIIVL